MMAQKLLLRMHSMIVCVSPACYPYIPDCTAPGHLPTWGVKMQGGVLAQGGVPANLGGPAQGVYLPGGWGCTCLGGGGVPALGEGDATDWGRGCT